ncbi:MAG: sulfatase-like hydrolase/transferase, partial [Planctomycetales bacterium]
MRLAALLGLALFVAANTETVFADKPNIVFIMADDLGWRDLSCFGSEYFQTPNVDKLAARGMKFTQAYAANPLCSPTRASVLTGLWPARIGITAPACHLPQVVLEKSLRKPGPRTRVQVAQSV